MSKDKKTKDKKSKKSKSEKKSEKKSKTIEFYDLKYRKKTKVPKKNCHLETIQTSRGERKRIVGVIRDNPDDPKKERNLSKLCSRDFEL